MFLYNCEGNKYKKMHVHTRIHSSLSFLSHNNLVSFENQKEIYFIKSQQMNSFWK